MATKTNVTKESVPRTAKVISPLAAPEKKAVNTKKVLVTLQTPPMEASRSAQTASKTKTNHVAASPEVQQQSVTKPAENQAKKMLPKVISVVDHAEPLNSPIVLQDHKWQEIRLILEKLKEDTLREIRKSVKNGTEAVAAIEPGGDIYDQASSERDRELGLLLGDREREKIHSIDEALLRIDDGDYGICEECDEDIPLGRLKAMPFTRHCVKCKSDLEKLQAQTKRVEEERAYREIPLGTEEDES